MSEEVKFKVGDQWFYRGNRSPQWLALASRSDGSACGISERVPAEMWPVLEELAKVTAQRDEGKTKAEAFDRVFSLQSGNVQRLINADIRAEVSERMLSAACDKQRELQAELAAARKEREGCVLLSKEIYKGALNYILHVGHPQQWLVNGLRAAIERPTESAAAQAAQSVESDSMQKSPAPSADTENAKP